MKRFVLFACFFVGLSNTALAGSIQVEQLQLRDAWIRETPPNHPATGGYHLMFMKLKQRMIPMDVHQVTLTFKNSGSVTVPMTVRKISHGMKHTH